MSKILAVLFAAGSVATATIGTASIANAQWGGDWHVGGDYYYPSYGDGYGAVPPAPVYGYGAVPAAPYAIVVVPAVPAVPTIAAVPAVPTAPAYGYGYGAAVAAPAYGYGYGAAVAAPAYGYGYASAGYLPYRNLYSYAPGYYARRWYWQ